VHGRARRRALTARACPFPKPAWSARAPVCRRTAHTMPRISASPPPSPTPLTAGRPCRGLRTSRPPTPRQRRNANEAWCVVGLGFGGAGALAWWGVGLGVGLRVRRGAWWGRRAAPRTAWARVDSFGVQRARRCSGVARAPDLAGFGVVVRRRLRFRAPGGPRSLSSSVAQEPGPARRLPPACCATRLARQPQRRRARRPGAATSNSGVVTMFTCFFALCWVFVFGSGGAPAGIGLRSRRARRRPRAPVRRRPGPRPERRRR
jgi:hypothetical protein